MTNNKTLKLFLKTNHRKKRAGEFLFLMRVGFSLAKNAPLLLVGRGLSSLKAHKALTVVYLLLFVQVLSLLMPSPSPSAPASPNPPSLEQTFSLEHTSFEKLALREQKIIEWSNSCNKIKQEGLVVENCSRSQLINCAVLNKELGDLEKYNKYLSSAKKLDPNWSGWN